MYPNRDGRLEFSKNELEKLLEETYNEGYKDGKNSNSYTNYYPSISYLNGVTCDGTPKESTCSTNTSDKSIKVSELILNNNNSVSLEVVDLKGNVE